MRLERNAPLLELALKRAAVRPLLSSQCTRHRYSSSSAAQPESIAVLGGGISGLSSAYFIGKEFPNSKITIYESSKQTGGWIRSQRVNVEGGTALFEFGPRTLRSSTVTGHLIQELGLVSDVTITPRDAPGAMNRYIYYPDRLNAVPSKELSFWHLVSLWRSGVLDGASGFVTESFRPRRPMSMTDETIGSFIERRVDKRIANNLVSAVFHGIYAGDIWQLSAKTLLGAAWNLEGRYGNIIRGFFQMQEDPQGRMNLFHPFDLDAYRIQRKEIDLEMPFAEQLARSSVFSFKGGLRRLVQALENKLNDRKNVEIRLNAPIQSFKPAGDGSSRVEVVTGAKAEEKKESYDLVISTLRNHDLTEFVNVMTVNMYFNQERLLPVQGFGYLIPQSVPFEQNPERALGVIFDSDAIPGLDDAKGTKVTVMLGGHYWNDWTGFPDEEEGLAMARTVLQRHLKITAEPVATSVNLARDCIPQYTVGYDERLRGFASSLQDEYKGRLRVVGNQFNGVGVNDCISAAWFMARGLRGDGWKSNSCGLERALDDRPWVAAPALESRYLYGKN